MRIAGGSGSLEAVVSICICIWFVGGGVGEWIGQARASRVAAASANSCQHQPRQSAALEKEV
jgi:hypothetical protein